MPSLIIFFLFMPLSTFAVVGAEAPELRQQYVVLLHGLSLSPWAMKCIEGRLKKNGYKVINAKYPSRKKSIEELADDVFTGKLAGILNQPDKEIHFVTHSMGGILLRSYCSRQSIDNIGRVVMIAPPNQGSQIADRLHDKRWFQKLMGPGACELGAGRGGIPGTLGPAPFSVGVIAGTLSLNPVFFRWLPGRNDGRVSLEATRLDNMKDFTTFHCNHTFLLWKPTVWDEIVQFLQHGRFKNSMLDSVPADSECKS
jgi:pimeloyl-ACP methyl ester carboxylesterase